MELFRACLRRYVLSLPIVVLIGIIGLVSELKVIAQTPAITVAPVISTVAGNGNIGFGGDGGPAISAQLFTAAAVAVDAAGNIYIADQDNSRIRKVDSSGIITTIAGNGTPGFGGDGGPATSAMLNTPHGVAVDSAGNVYIADQNNNRIRKVDTSGNITTIAGDGTPGFGGDGGQATNSVLNSPYGVAVDAAGNVYIADTNNSRIRKVNASGVITTVAGNETPAFSGDGSSATSAALNYPNGVAVDTAGNVYVVDTYNRRIRMVNSGGIITTIAGNGTAGFSGDGGAATSAALNYPHGVAVDTAGNIYIADTSNSRIRKVNASGTITTLGGNGTLGFGGDGGPVANALFYYPNGVAVDPSGNLYIADQDNNRIRRVQPSILPYPNTQVGQTSAVQNIYLQINHPLTITSYNIPLAEAISRSTDFSIDISNLVCDSPTSPYPPGTICTIPITFSPKYPGKRDAPLKVFTNLGTFTFGLVGTGVAPQVAIVPGMMNPVISNVSSASNPYVGGVARDASGLMYIATSDQQIKKVDTLGTITNFAGTGATCTNQTATTSPCGDGGLAIDATFVGAYNVALDAAGNVYISDGNGQRIRKVDANGVITTVAGNGTTCSPSTAACGDGGLATSAQLNSPLQVAVDKSGNLFIADQSDNRIRKVDTSGVITTVAGTGVRGSTGDGGLATAATFWATFGVAVDVSGNLYIADGGNRTIRKVDAVTGIITSIAGAGGLNFPIPVSGLPATQANIAPNELAVDAAGDVYITELAQNRVLKVDAGTGTIRPIAGSSRIDGNTGDGGPATDATLSQPYGIALDSIGNVYIGDRINNRIRQISITAAPLAFPDTTIGQSSPTQAAYVSNIGNGELNFTGLPISADFFLDPSNSCENTTPILSAGNSCTLNIGFKPQQAGPRTGTQTVFDDALNIPGSTQVIPLSGNGLPVPTTIVLSLSTSSSIDTSTPVKLTANVTPYSAGGVTTTGFISFFDNGIPLVAGSVAISPTGEASITMPSFAAGTHTLTAAYGGDANFNACVSADVPLTVTAPPIAIELSSSDNPSNYGQSVTFTAKVPSGATGTVNFYDGATQIAGPVTISGTTAPFTTSTLAIGLHPITARYSGDGTHGAATSGALDQIVNPAVLTVTLTSATRPYGEPEPTFTYTIAGFAGTDTQAVVSGVPQITTTATAGSNVGTYPITATVGTLAASSYTFQFAPATLTITKATPGGDARTLGVIVACSPNPSVWGQSVSCMATLPANATGSVAFLDGTSTLGTGTILDEHASFTTTQLAVTTHPITAVYGGDTNYNGAASSVLSQVVNKATLSVIAANQQKIYGQPNPSLTTNVSGFANGDTSAVISGSAVVTTTATTTSPPGEYPITVTRGTLAATNYNFVTVDGTLLVAAAAGTVTIATSSPSVPAGTPVTFTATVPAAETGTVQFYDGTTLIGTGTIANGIATLTISTLSQGTHQITAVYSGDANFTTASSTVLAQVITAPVVVADFDVSSNTPRQLIPPGASATYNIILNSVSSPFTNAVTLTASGLPPGATYTFTPPSVIPGSSGATSSLAVAVPIQAAAASRFKTLAPLSLALLGLPLALMRRRRNGSPRLLLWMLVSFATLGAVVGCGTGGYFSQSEQTYTITVTGTSGSLSHSTTVTLAVE